MCQVHVPQVITATEPLAVSQLCLGTQTDATWPVNASRTDSASFASTGVASEHQSCGLGTFGDAVGQAQQEALGRGKDKSPVRLGVRKGSAFAGQVSPEEQKGTSPWKDLRGER